MLVFGYDDAVARWVGGQLSIDDFGPSRAIGVMRADVLVAGAVYHNYHPRHRCAEISFASVTAKWATRDTIRALLRYPFVQLNCERLTAVSRADNEDARDFLKRLGFQQEGYHRKGWGDEDAVSYGMLRGECRWIGDIAHPVTIATAFHARLGRHAPVLH